MKSFFSIAVAATLIVMAATVASCNKEDTKEQCVTLEQNGYSITVCGDENGTASITNVITDVGYDWITFTATANSGYRFVEWQIIEDGITVSRNPLNPATSNGMSYTSPVYVYKAIFVPLVVLPNTVTIHNGIHARSTEKYYYDIQNRIISQGLTYDNDGDRIKYKSCYTSARCTNAWLTKNGNKITVSKSYHPTAYLFGSVNGELELNAQGLPVKLTYKEESENGATFFVNTTTHTVVSLTWQNENLTKIEWESESVIEERHDWEEESVITRSSNAGTVTYTHDDKKTPFYHCNTPKWFFWWFSYDGSFNEIDGYNKNNIKTATREDGSITTYEYTYNDAGFPVTRTWESTNKWDPGTIMEMYTYYQ